MNHGDKLELEIRIDLSSNKCVQPWVSKDQAVPFELHVGNRTNRNKCS